MIILGVNPNFFKISVSVPLFDFSTGVCDLDASGPFSRSSFQRSEYLFRRQFHLY